MIDQQHIDKQAARIWGLFHNENSGAAVLALLSVIEVLALDDRASIAFRRQTVALLKEQAERIQAMDAPPVGRVH